MTTFYSVTLKHSYFGGDVYFPIASWDYSYRCH